MLLQAIGLAAAARSPLAPLLTRLAGPLASSNGPAARYALGVVLGFLPCGLLYGALAAAAGTASTGKGALAMAAFAGGTMPALSRSAGGSLLRRRLRDVARWIAPPLLIANAMVMLALAGNRL